MIDFILQTLGMVCDTFSSVSEFLSRDLSSFSPVFSTVGLGDMSLLVLMLGGGLFVFLGYQLVKWILDIVL